MRWIKHSSGICRSPAMSEVRDVLGVAGYGAVWIILERIAETWDGQGEPSLCLPEREWRHSCSFSKKKFEILEKVLQKHDVIRVEKHNSMMSITASILLQIQDEWTRRARKNSGVAPEPLRSHAGIQTDKEAEEDKDKKTHPRPSLRPHLLPVLKRHGIQPDSERGRRITRHIEGKQPDNPGGYLESILQRKPQFDPAPEGVSTETDTEQEDAVSVGTILRRMQLS